MDVQNYRRCCLSPLVGLFSHPPGRIRPVLSAIKQDQPIAIRILEPGFSPQPAFVGWELIKHNSFFNQFAHVFIQILTLKINDDSFSGRRILDMMNRKGRFSIRTNKPRVAGDRIHDEGQPQLLIERNGLRQVC